MTWSPETQRYLAEERMIERADQERWEEQRVDAFSRDFTESDKED